MLSTAPSARRQRKIEAARVVAALLALVVARVAVDEAVGQHEVHRFAGEGLERAVVRPAPASARRGGAARRSRGAAGSSGERDASTACGIGMRLMAARRSVARARARCTRSTHRPATNRLMPPIASA